MDRKLSRATILLAFSVALLASAFVMPPAQSSPGSSGAILTLRDQTIHVVWQFYIEYGSSEMAEEVDGLHEALRHNHERVVETQLESFITDALKQTNENMTCRNSRILLETNIGTWAEVLLEFDVEGAVDTDGDFLRVDMSWRDFTVKGKVKYVRGRTEYGFYPRKSLGLQWPFSPDLDRWSVSKEGDLTKFRYVYDDGVEIIKDVTLKTVNMTITVPDTATGVGDYIRIPRGSSGSGNTSIVLPQLPRFVNLGIIAVVGVAVFLSAMHLWRQREGSARASRVAQHVAESSIITEYLEALDRWERQTEHPRIKRNSVFHGGSLIFRIPNLKFSIKIRDHYLQRYTERGESI